MMSRGEIETLVERHVQRYGIDPSGRRRRRRGLRTLLDWLAGGAPEAIAGANWQHCWEQRGEPAADWVSAAGAMTAGDRVTLSMTLQTLMLEGVIRPSYAWLLRTPQHRLYEKLRATTAREDFDRLSAAGAAAGHSAATAKQAEIVLGKVVVHTGRPLPATTTADLLEYAAAIGATGRNAAGVRVAHQLLRQAGWITDPPLSPGYTARLSKPSIAHLVERQGIACTEVRDLLIRYLTERTVALDYPSARQLTIRLAKMFWKDIERHHPGIASLDLPRSVVEAWRQRQEILSDGRLRKDPHELFMTVRSFYLDLAQWAAADPARWRQYAYPCPISPGEIRAYRKARLHRQARMQERTRLQLPHLPRLLAQVRTQRTFAHQLLTSAAACADGDTFVLEGRSYQRVAHRWGNRTPRLGTAPVMVRPLAVPERPLLNCHDREDEAFWAWAVIEVLHLTGIRVEELLELTHLSIQRATMADGQQVLLLQIAPSKRDRERVLPVCPELAHVLATIVTRIRNGACVVPSVERFDPLERTMSAPLPYLFQRQWRTQGAVMNAGTVAMLIAKACRRAGLVGVDGAPLSFTPHDFRRLFATDAVNGGLPIHIAAKLLGHLDLNTTKGYVAVYPDEVVRQYRAHLARRRVSRPAVEYQEPTDREWEEFAAHFRRRKLALGDCYRPYGTECPHEHACVRCPMLRMDPAQLPRLIQIEQNTRTLLAEAREQGWEGEAVGLDETLGHIQEKKAQVARIARAHTGLEDFRRAQ